MLYMALIYSEPGTEPTYGTDDWKTMMGDYEAFNEKLAGAGAMVAGHALHSTSEATSVRVRNGKTETMDGPFAETKERLGGYYIFDCEDLDQALAFAAQIPTAVYGTVEVRPVMDLG